MSRRGVALLFACSVAAALATAMGAADDAPQVELRTIDALVALKGGAEGHAAGIKILAAADVAADITEAKRKHDRRLIGFVVNQMFVPGLDPAAKNQPPRGYTVVRIMGTSDDLAPGAQERFMKLLAAYAREYNHGLLSDRWADKE
jgi:hypothetical protein